MNLCDGASDAIGSLPEKQQQEMDTKAAQRDLVGSRELHPSLLETAFLVLESDLHKHEIPKIWRVHRNELQKYTKEEGKPFYKETLNFKPLISLKEFKYAWITTKTVGCDSDVSLVEINLDVGFKVLDLDDTAIGRPFVVGDLQFTSKSIVPNGQGASKEGTVPDTGTSNLKEKENNEKGKKKENEGAETALMEATSDEEALELDRNTEKEDWDTMAEATGSHMVHSNNEESNEIYTDNYNVEGNENHTDSNNEDAKESLMGATNNEELSGISKMEEEDDVIIVEERKATGLSIIISGEDFQIYLRAFLCQAVDSTFLKIINQKKDDYFLLPIKRIDFLVDEQLKKLQQVLKWTDEFKDSLLTRAEIVISILNYSSEICQACRLTKACQKVLLSGPEYNQSTLEILRKLEQKELFVCQECQAYLVIYHGLVHYKYSLQITFKEELSKRNARKEGYYKIISEIQQKEEMYLKQKLLTLLIKAFDLTSA